MRSLLLLMAMTGAALGQTPSRLNDYAVVLQDEPVVRRVQSRAALRSAEALRHASSIRAAQSNVMAELTRRGARVTGATQVLVNAVLVAADTQTAARLRDVPGVKYIVPVGKA